MKKIIQSMTVIALAAIMTVALAACGLSDTSVAGIQKYGKLVVATNAAFPPFEYRENGKIVGWDMDVAQLFADELGVKLEIKDMDFDSVLAAPGAKKAHIAMAGISKNPTREESMSFTDDIFDSSQMIIVRMDDTSIAGPADLAGKKVGAQTGTVGYFLASMDEDWAYDFNEDGSVNLEAPILGAPSEAIKYDNGALAVAGLINGNVDAVIIDKYPAQKFVEANAGKVKLLDVSVFEDSYAFAVAKGNQDLVDFLNRCIHENQDKLAEITTKYFG